MCESAYLFLLLEKLVLAVSAARLACAWTQLLSVGLPVNDSSAAARQLQQQSEARGSTLNEVAKSLPQAIPPSIQCSKALLH